ncbi:hypothetical protein Q3G72_022618 [Acer saccharum]|nr:hypothetical protein Q3G72_022618 [Acer saccharum]
MEKASSSNPQIKDLDGSIKKASDTEGAFSSNPEIKNLDVGFSWFVVVAAVCSLFLFFALGFVCCVAFAPGCCSAVLAWAPFQLVCLSSCLPFVAYI